MLKKAVSSLSGNGLFDAENYCSLSKGWLQAYVIIVQANPYVIALFHVRSDIAFKACLLCVQRRFHATA